MFQKLGADTEHTLRIGSGKLNDDKSIAAARFTKGEVKLQFGEALFRNPTTGDVKMTIDVSANKEFANKTSGSIDPNGVTTVGHELFHANDAFFNSAAQFRAGDIPSSSTGPAHLFGQEVFNERPDMSATDAAEIVDRELNEGNCTAPGGRCADRVPPN